jgi:hypothetical protein
MINPDVLMEQMMEKHDNLNKRNNSLDETKKYSLDKRKKNFWWIISIMISIFLGVILFWELYKEAQIEPPINQITNPEELHEYLEANWKTRHDPDALILPTGIYLESLRFVNDSDVHLSGYVWQRRTDGVHDHLSEGFFFPEQVDSIIEPREAYRVREGDEEVIGWYFEGVFRHHYDYKRYPFDHKSVWLRIWSKDINENLILVPDFGSYPCPDNPNQSCTEKNHIFGVSEFIVLDEFERDQTYFDYFLASYNSNFGIYNDIGQDDLPELRFNLLLRRKSEDAFILFIIPLIVVTILTFITLMVTTSVEVKSSRFGYSVFEVIKIITALIFVVIISQGQIREKFPGSGFVFLEMFYFLIYIMLLIVAANAYLVSLPKSEEWKLISYEDNLIPKVTFLPFLLGVLLLITIIYL